MQVNRGFGSIVKDRHARPYATAVRFAENGCEGKPGHDDAA
jgi:hypothetical protein